MCGITMRAVWFKRSIVILGGIGLLVYVGMFLKGGQEPDKHLETSINNLRELRQWRWGNGKKVGFCMICYGVVDYGNWVT